MTELAANAYVKLLGGNVFSHKYLVDTTYATHIYKGQPIMLSGAGLAKPYTGSITVGPTDVCLGVAAEEVNVAAGAVAYVEVHEGPTVVGFKSAVFDGADLGKTIYADTSDTLTETAADNLELGKLIEVADGYAFVELNSPDISAGA